MSPDRQIGSAPSRCFVPGTCCRQQAQRSFTVLLVFVHDGVPTSNLRRTAARIQVHKWCISSGVWVAGATTIFVIPVRGVG
jgi:hypothetical protein